MAIGLKEITQEEVERVLRRNLDLGGDIRIGRNDRIKDLVEYCNGEFDSTDLLELLHELGINGWKYSSGEKLNEEGFKMLSRAVFAERINKDVVELLYRHECARGERPVITTDEIVKMITLGYLIRMAEYDAEHKHETA